MPLFMVCMCILHYVNTSMSMGLSSERESNCVFVHMSVCVCKALIYVTCLLFRRMAGIKITS